MQCNFIPGISLKNDTIEVDDAQSMDSLYNIVADQREETVSEAEVEKLLQETDTILAIPDSSFVTKLKDLELGKRYYYMAVAIINDSVYKGKCKWFRTQCPLTHTYITFSSNAGVSRALLKGRLNPSWMLRRWGGSVELGFYISDKYYSSIWSHPEKNCQYISSKDVSKMTGKFQAYAEDLEPNTRYYFKAVAIVNGKRYYGAQNSFKTQKIASKTLSPETESENCLETIYLTGQLILFNEEAFATHEQVKLGFYVSKKTQPANDPDKLFVGSTYEGESLREVIKKRKFKEEMQKMPAGVYYCQAVCEYESKAYPGSNTIKITVTATDDQAGPTQSKIVELGLSVKWAGWNLGAEQPEQPGNYYAWGETTSKESYSPDKYEYHYEDPEGYTYDRYIGYNISGTKYDAARTNWGEDWRMPTTDEVQELMNNCKITYTTYKGVEGLLVYSPTTCRSIFLPDSPRPKDFYVTARTTDYWTGTVNPIEDESLGEMDNGGAYRISLKKERMSLLP